MTITEIEVVETTEETHHDDIVHLRCCRQPKAVCGTICDEDGKTDKVPDCVVCVGLGQAAKRHLALMGHVHCPLDFSVLCPEVKK